MVNTEWIPTLAKNIYIFFNSREKTIWMSLLLLLLLSHFSRVRLCATPETAAHQAPPSLGFSRQEHWSGLPFPSPMHESEKWKGSRSVMSDSSRPHGLQPTRLLCPWDFPGKSTGVGCHCLLIPSLIFLFLSSQISSTFPLSPSLTDLCPSFLENSSTRNWSCINFHLRFWLQPTLIPWGPYSSLILWASMVPPPSCSPSLVKS